MSYKQWAEEVSEELKKAQDEKAQLRRQLAERDEQLIAATKAGYQTTHTQCQQQVAEIQKELQEANEAKDNYAKQAAQSETQFQGTIAKLGKVEQEYQGQIQTLQNQLAGKNEHLRNVQVTRAADQAPNDREKKLKEQITKFNGELKILTIDNARLKKTNESLTKQLQVEKTENAERLAFMKSNPGKVHNQDDEEELPSTLPTPAPTRQPSVDTSPRGSASTQKAFKMPASVPEHLLNPNSLSNPNPKRGRKPAAKPTKVDTTRKPEKKRKRSVQEELEDEITDLQTGGAHPVAPEPRKRKNISRDEDSEDDDIHLGDGPTPKGFRSWGKSNTQGTASQDVEQFNFKAICNYNTDGSVNQFYPSKDLGACEELWERIEIISRGIWERNKGGYWQWEFERQKYAPMTPPCVTKKCQGGRTRWRLGCEGAHACKDCVAAGRPCFTYVFEMGDDGYKYGQFVLLPMHKDDQKKTVVVGKNELCYWVNDDTKLVDPDSMGSDEEY